MNCFWQKNVVTRFNNHDAAQAIVVQAKLPTLEHLEAAGTLLSVFDVDYISTEALMFQAGYLTLDSERVVAGKYMYKLRFPNEEVRQSLFGSLLEVWHGQSSKQTKNTISLFALLNTGVGI